MLKRESQIYFFMNLYLKLQVIINRIEELYYQVLANLYITPIR